MNALTHHFNSRHGYSIVFRLLSLMLVVSFALTAVSVPASSQSSTQNSNTIPSSPSIILPAYMWHTFYGPSGPDHNVVVDRDGNIYIAGFSDSSWQGDANAWPLHPYTGGDDLFVMKLDHNGVYQWHTFYGSSSRDRTSGIVVDETGNVYVAGWSEAAWLGDGDVAPLHSFSGSTDIWVMKLNNSGAYQWHTFYGVQDSSRTIAIDQENNIYVVSSSASSWQGSNGAAPRHAYSGGWDSAILKLNSQWTYLWHTFYGSSSSDLGDDIAVDGSNNIYVLGTSEAPWQNGTVTELHSHSGQIDLYVLKLNSAGTYQWHTFYGSSANDSAEGLTTDGRGNIYILGHSNSAWQGDQGVDALHPYHPVGFMFFNYVVMKLSSAGSYQWHTFYGYNDSGDGDIITDRVGNVYFTSGSDSGWLGDNDSPPLHQFDGSGEIVITRLNSAGGYQWHTFYGSNLIDYGEDIAMDERGSLVVVGGSTASWQADGNSNPIHPYPAGAVYALVVLKLDAVRLTQFYLPLIIGAVQPVSAIVPLSRENH